MDIDQAITTVRAAVGRLDEATEAVAAAKEALQREALRVLVAAEDEAEARQVLHRLYWDVPEVPIKTLEAVAGSSTRVYKLVGPGPVVARCEDCAADIRAKSRTHAARGVTVCDDCLEVRRKAELERWREPGPDSWDRWEDELDGPPDGHYPCC